VVLVKNKLLNEPRVADRRATAFLRVAWRERRAFRAGTDRRNLNGLNALAGYRGKHHDLLGVEPGRAAHRQAWTAMLQAADAIADDLR
jgi:hypothetical protein